MLDYILNELFDRNVKWALDKHPELNYDMSDKDRLRTSWNCNETSLRLIMFQVYFLRNVGLPYGKKLEDILDYYNYSCGIPQTKTKNDLFANVKEIINISSFREFHEFIGLEYSGDSDFASKLLQSIDNSLKKGYHRSNSKLYNRRRSYY